ncbi:helix-turn-helix domain-containing protein [Paenibacillus xerothermodurans]
MAKVEALLSDGELKLGHLYVSDGSGQRLLSIGHPTVYTLPEKEQSANDGGFFIHMNNREYFVSTLISPHRDRHYILMTSVDFIRQDLKRITNLVWCVTTMLILAGIVLAVVLAKGKYKPIKKIADGFSAKMKTVPKEPSDELKLIEWAADTALKEKEQFLSAMQRQLPVLRSNVLLRLIQGSIPAEQNALQSIGVEFHQRYFCVILVHVDQYSGGTMKDRNFSKFVIGNVLEHLGRELGQSYVVDLDPDRVALLINIDQANDAADMQLQELAAKALEFIGLKYHSTITISIGGVHEKLEGVHASYQEAVRAMEYQILKGYSSVINFGDIKTLHNPQTTYDYPIQTEELLIHSIKHGDIAKVRAIMSAVYQMNFVTRHLPLQMARCLFFDLMGTSIKVLNSSVMDFENIFADGPQPYERLISSRTIQEMQHTLLWIYEKICAHIQAQKNQHSTQLKDRITAYIGETFTDPNLSLTKVAGVFNLNPSYLSGLFKDQVGENFLNYVNKLRVEAAKKYLVEQSVSLQEIAARVGYSNNVVLIRNFKKHVGMTPSEYREKRR